MSDLRIGAKLPNSGPLPLTLGIPAMARRLEEAGFASLWVSDHIVLPGSIDSRYPFAEDGRATWPTDTPYLDALVALALAAAATERATLGTAVLVLPLRQPVVFAKQAASIDVASGGRLRLGVGAGWLRGGVRRARRAVRRSRPPPRGVDRDRARLLDGTARGPRVRALHAARRRALPPLARAPDPRADGRTLPGRADARRPDRRRLARPAVAARACTGRARVGCRADARGRNRRRPRSSGARGRPAHRRLGRQGRRRRPQSPGARRSGRLRGHRRSRVGRRPRRAARDPERAP